MISLSGQSLVFILLNRSGGAGKLGFFLLGLSVVLGVVVIGSFIITRAITKFQQN